MIGRNTLRITNIVHIFAKVMDAVDRDIQFYHCIARGMAMRMGAVIHICRRTYCIVSVQRGCTLYNGIMALQRLENLLL